MTTTHKRARDEERQDECPVCFEPLVRTHWIVADNALSCQAGHNVCVSCVRTLVVPSCHVRRLTFKCPMCRVDAILAPVHDLVLIKGSWTNARNSFPCVYSFREWVRNKE